MNQSVLVTLTAPTCSGKSYLLNFIRDTMQMPCLVSTTTRAPRAGEREGIDYYFISKEESIQLENEDKFAELAIYNGTRYGVTREEFKSKLDTGLTFLIVEPTGIDHYVQPALDVGARHLKIFVDTPYDIRMSRFMKRFLQDLREICNSSPVDIDKISKCVNTNNSRLESMTAQEQTWKNMHEWDLIIDGQVDPKINLQKILTTVKEK